MENNKNGQHEKNRGVFWIIDEEILAVPYFDTAAVGVAKSGDNYNHRLLWDYVKPKRCNKPFDYYPRGRVEVNNRGKTVVYMSPYIGEEYIPRIMECFGLTDVPRIHYDGSDYYKCYCGED